MKVIAAGLSGLLLLAGAAPAFAGFGAVALDEESGRYGATWDKSSQKAAQDSAMKDCGAPGCRIVFTVPPRHCAALATGDKGKTGKVAWGGADKSTRDAAKLDALENCQKHTSGKCEIRASECNR
jgi:hypothetical protein